MRSSTALTGALLSFLLVSSAAAGPIEWKLGEDQMATYTTKVEKQRKGAGALSVLFPSPLRLRSRDITKSLTYNKPLTDFGRLILRYGLSLPATSKKKATLKIDETLSGVSSYRLAIKSTGRLKVRRGSSRLLIEGALNLSQGNRPSPQGTVQRGVLTWSTVVSSKKGVVTTCNYALTLEFATKGATKTTYKIDTAGSITLSGLETYDPKKLRGAVEPTIKRGVDRLRRLLNRGNMAGMRMGSLALGVFAMLRSGVPPSDPVAVKCFDALSRMPQTTTYDVSLYIMALEARSVKRSAPSDGGTIPRYERKGLGKGDKKLIEGLAAWLVQARNIGKGTWHYKGANAGEGEGGVTPRPGAYDNSNTQFAVLALHAAARSGVKVSVTVWEEIYRHFCSVQCRPSGSGSHDIVRTGEKRKPRKGKRGGSTKTRRRGRTGSEAGGGPYRGWSYAGPSTPYGSMTGAGLSSITIAAEMLKEEGKLGKKAEADFKERVAAGLRWFAANYSVSENPGNGGSGWYFYYLYSLEKACELLTVDSFDSHDWFLEGTQELISRQNKDGGWGTGASNVNHTALALLFLNRATLRTTVSLMGRRAATGGDPSQGRDNVLIEEAGGIVSMENLIAAMEGGSKSEKRKLMRWVTKGIKLMAEADRAVVVPLLVPMLDEKSTAGWARKQLRSVTGDARMKDASEFSTWHDQWQTMDTAAAKRAFHQIPLLGKILRGSRSPLLCHTAMLTAVRLEAVELVAAIAPFLEKRNDREIANSCLTALMERAPSDRADAESWARDKGPSKLKIQTKKRSVLEALYGDKSAYQRVKSLGEPYIEALVDFSTDSKVGRRARELLKAITGASVSNDGWGEWWSENKHKAKGERSPGSRAGKSAGAPSGSGSATPPGPGAGAPSGGPSAGSASSLAALAPHKAALKGADIVKRSRARKAIQKLGKRAIPGLIEWLGDDAYRRDALLMLRLMTGVDAGSSQGTWRQWWSRNSSKVDADGTFSG